MADFLPSLHTSICLAVGSIHSKAHRRSEWSVCSSTLPLSMCPVLPIPHVTDSMRDNAQARFCRITLYGSFIEMFSRGSDWQCLNSNSFEASIMVKVSLPQKSIFICDSAWSISSARCTEELGSLWENPLPSVWRLRVALILMDSLGFWHTEPGFASMFWSACPCHLSLCHLL